MYRVVEVKEGLEKPRYKVQKTFLFFWIDCKKYVEGSREGMPIFVTGWFDTKAEAISWCCWASAEDEKKKKTRRVVYILD